MFRPHRTFTLDGNTPHQTTIIFLVVRRGSVQQAAIVPDHHIADLPFVTVYELGSRSELGEALDQFEACCLVHAANHADIAKAQIEILRGLLPGASALAGE